MQEDQEFIWSSGYGNGISNVSSSCANPENSTDKVAESCSFWFEGVAMVVVGSAGILGNLTTIIILSTREMRNSFNLLLTILSTCDILFTVIALMDYSLARVFKWPFDINSEIYTFIFPKLLYPFNNIIFNCSIGLTIVIAYERYNAVCRPHHFHHRSVANTSAANVANYAVPVFVFSTILNIPKFFETELVTVEMEITNYNTTADRNVSQFANITTYLFTDLRNDKNYITFYVNWGKLVLTGLLPVTALLYFNICIYRRIKYAHIRSHRNNNSCMHNEMNLSVILVCIVVVFLLCHLPRLAINCAEFTMTDSIINCEDFTPPAWFLCSTSLMHLLLIVNSSSNFAIYCLMGNKFKSILVDRSKSLYARISRRKKDQTEAETQLTRITCSGPDQTAHKFTIESSSQNSTKNISPELDTKVSMV